MEQIRNLAISGVDTLEKANKVCEIVGDDVELNINIKKWLFDNDADLGFMAKWGSQENHPNFKNCTQMTYEEFLEKYDKPTRFMPKVKFNLDIKYDKQLSQLLDSLKVSDTQFFGYSTNDSGDMLFGLCAENYGELDLPKVSYLEAIPELVSDVAKMRAEFEANPDKWVVYIKYIGVHDVPKIWHKLDSQPEWLDDIEYKPILKEHEEIFDAIIANSDTVIKYKIGVLHNVWTTFVGNFVENYDADLIEKNGISYQLAKPQCDGKLSELAETAISYIEQKPTISKMETVETNSIEDLNELSIVGEEEMTIKKEFLAFDTISIADDNGKEYKFKKPEFECELLKVMHPKSKLPDILAIIANDIIVTFFTNGECYYMDESDAFDYNLTPIKPKWYDNESNFPAVMIDEESQTPYITDINGILKGSRLATKEEVNSLYYQDKE